MRLFLSIVCTAVVLAVAPRCPALLTTVVGTDAPFPEALAALLGLTLTLVSCWALLVVTLSCLGPTGSRLATALTPRLLRGALVAATSAALTTTPAVASDPLDGLRLPERVTSEPRDAVPPPAPTDTGVAAPPRHRAGDVSTVRVRPGDTLWSLVGERHRRAATARVAREVERWHALNRGTIGADPDLLRPGQRLHVPQGSR